MPYVIDRPVPPNFARARLQGVSSFLCTTLGPEHVAFNQTDPRDHLCSAYVTNGDQTGYKIDEVYADYIWNALLKTLRLAISLNNGRLPFVEVADGFSFDEVLLGGRLLRTQYLPSNMPSPNLSLPEDNPLRASGDRDTVISRVEALKSIGRQLLDFLEDAWFRHGDNTDGNGNCFNFTDVFCPAIDRCVNATVSGAAHLVTNNSWSILCQPHNDIMAATDFSTTTDMPLENQPSIDPDTLLFPIETAHSFKTGATMGSSSSLPTTDSDNNQDRLSIRSMSLASEDSLDLRDPIPTHYSNRPTEIISVTPSSSSTSPTSTSVPRSRAPCGPFSYIARTHFTKTLISAINHAKNHGDFDTLDRMAKVTRGWKFASNSEDGSNDDWSSNSSNQLYVPPRNPNEHKDSSYTSAPTPAVTSRALILHPVLSSQAPSQLVRYVRPITIPRYSPYAPRVLRQL